MIRKDTIFNILILTLLVCYFALVPASASERPTFEKMPDYPNFIANMGTMPNTTNETEWNNWSDSVMRCWAKMTEESPLYSEFGDAVTNIIPAEDFVIMEISSEYTNISNHKIEEIYHNIDLFCEQEGVNEIPVSFLWQEGTHFPLPEYGPMSLEKVKKDPLFIASRGTMPVIVDNEEKWAWVNRLGQCYPNVSWFRPYIINGPVSGAEPSYNGYLIIRFDAGIPEKVNDSLINEIYQQMDAQCEKGGISNVPVVFFWKPIDTDVIYINQKSELKTVGNYSDLQASLPDVLKGSPYSYIAFAATDKESQTVYLTAIDESDLDAKKKAELKADLQDIWNRYPDGFVVADNLVLQDVDRIMTARFIENENLSAGENGDYVPQDGKTSQQIPGFTSFMLVLIIILKGKRKTK